MKNIIQTITALLFTLDNDSDNARSLATYKEDSSTADGSSPIFTYIILTYPGINSGQACLNKRRLVETV